MKLQVVILAAGQGTRMQSRLPKVLHPLAGKPFLEYVVDNALALRAHDTHVVVGHGADVVQERLASYAVNWVQQTEQLGTGHAVAQALPAIDDDSVVLVLYGDVPLTSKDTLEELLAQVNDNSLALLTVNLSNPAGYGRIVRDDDGQVLAIVEEKDASDEQRLICEGNTGILAVSGAKLKKWLPTLSSDNAQGEYYLTDTIAMAAADGMDVVAVFAKTEEEVQGINSRQQQAALERWYQLQQANALMVAGATLADPARIDIRGKVSHGQDIYIDVNAVFEGDVSLGNDVQIGPNVHIINSSIGDGVTINANTVIENTIIAAGCQIGPYARLRPGTRLAENAKIGNFVEIKQADIGPGSKVNHLSYVGDAKLGRDVNVGAGTITCNYDGANKHLTDIGDNVFVGSNSALVAPIKVEAGATIGAGSTLSADVEAESLVVARVKPRVVRDWARPLKKPK
jgi:bifunctional UDP-N-acetylglucosamine pyrophosphorylase / glucosamine-1-phosphate N-acetyltransferase